MTGEVQGGMQCAEFETLLADALDGVLSQPAMATFQTHAAACGNCGPMLADARAGRTWLHALEPVEPPRHLVHNILVATTGASAAAPAPEAAAQLSPWRQRLRGWTRPLAPAFSTVLQPRFALSVGMAFFSLTLLLNAAGLHLTSLRTADLRPRALQENLVRSYYDASSRVVKYYENIRFVYEIESRVRDFRNAARPEPEPQAQPQKPKDQKPRDDNTSGRPEQRNQRYTRQEHTVILAGSPQPPEFVHPISSRRVA